MTPNGITLSEPGLMEVQHGNSSLNDALAAIYRSLLQYTAECYPWTDDATGGPELTAIRQMQSEQNRQISQIAELLNERSWVIDFGVYPTEFTDLHYVGLDFLLRQLVTDEARLMQQLDGLARDAGHDATAVALLRGAAAEAKGHVQKLRELSTQHTRR